MAKKVQGKNLVWGIDVCMMVLNDTKLVLNEHLESIWYHSEPSDVHNPPNQFLALDIFCYFLQLDSSRTLRANVFSYARMPERRWNRNWNITTYFFQTKLLCNSKYKQLKCIKWYVFSYCVIYIKMGFHKKC